MGIRSEVERLADLVADAKAPLSPWEHRLYVALRQMDEVDDLGWWEHRYHHVSWHGSSELKLPDTPTTDLFDAIYDFGRTNLYGAFDAQLTAERYAEVVALVNAALGQEVQLDDPPSDW